MVTHAKTTMEAANVLYGVTMEEPGVSKRVAVRLGDTAPVPGGAPATDAPGADVEAATA